MPDDTVRPLRIALTATGRIADDALAPAIDNAAGARLWSVLSRDAGRARDFAARHGAAAPQPACTDLDALLADPDLDAVLIASPDGLHAAQCIAAANAGKHVLCEKPMATTAADAERMTAACRDAGVRLGIAYHMRWHRGHRDLARAVHAGRLGVLRHMRVQWSMRAPDDSNWRAHAEVGRWWGLAAVGTHCLDQVRWYMMPSCGEVTRLTPHITRNVFRGPHDETALLALEFESGATAEICTSVLFDAPKRMEVYGSEGYALFDDTLGRYGKGRIATHEGEHGFEPADPFTGEVEDFAAAVREGRDPEVNGEEGARNVALLEEAIT